MKETVLSSVLTVLCILSLAQTPESFNYQVVVRDGTTNNPLTNQSVSFRLNILKGSSSGISQYSELHSANTGTMGIVNLVIGNGTSKVGSISSIDWGADIYYLKVEIDKTGGTSYVEIGTTQLLSVPYALFAKNSESAATKEYVDELLKALGLMPENFDGFLIDIDNNSYKTVKIGTQSWMAENLKTTRYRNGESIPNVVNDGEWLNLNTGAYCDLENFPSMSLFYGHLYNWFACVDPRNLCPTGWHIPSQTEWETLTGFLGAEYNGKLKETGTTHWEVNPDATNETQFTALPAGKRDPDGAFNSYGLIGFWWSTAENSFLDAGWSQHLYYTWPILFDYLYPKQTGCSVRCIKD